MFINKSKLIRVCIIFLLSSIILNNTLGFPVIYSKSLKEQLDELQLEIEQIKDAKSLIEAEINTNQAVINTFSSDAAKIYEEILVFQKNIEELELQIKVLDLNIKITEEEIEKKIYEIRVKEDNIKQLEDESDERIKDNYYKFRLYGSTDVNTSSFLNVDNANSFFKDSQYKEIIQRQTNLLMKELAGLKENLIKSRKELDEKKVSLGKEKDFIEIKRLDFSKKQDELKAKQEIYYREIYAIQNKINNKQVQILSFSEEEAKKNAEADRIKIQLFNSFSPANEGQFVVAGKVIGRQGATGFVTGAHLHFIVWDGGNYQNPCDYLSGCSGGGILSFPLDPGPTITSGYGERCFKWGSEDYCDMHNGVDMVTSPWNGPVYASHDGYIYKGVDGYGALYIILCEESSCSSGIKTGYWHLSEY